MLQLTNETQLASFNLFRSYDSLGRSAGYELHAPSSTLSAVSYTYDDLGRFSSVSSSVQSASSAVQYSYLEGSDLIGGYTTDSGLAVSYAFEDNRNAKTTVLNEFGTNLVSQFDYTYDPLMRRTQRTDVSYQGSEVTTNGFSYNARSELTNAVMSADAYGYDYDSIGNRLTASTPLTSSTYVANDLNQYTQTISTNLTTSTVSTNALSYDLDGNLLSDGITTYSWNGENRLVQASNATTVVAFKYDYQGRRFEKTVNATNTARFVYDGWAMIHEESSSETNSYVYGLDLSGSKQGAGTIGGLLSVTVAGGDDPGTFFPAYDANGNVTDYVSTNGTVVAHYEYDAFGKITDSSSPMADDFAFRFSTKYFDVETGLSYYGYRYYSPELGRWLSRDPSEEYGGANLYVFCFNSPIMLIDTDGRAPQLIGVDEDGNGTYTGDQDWGDNGKGAGGGQDSPASSGEQLVCVFECAVIGAACGGWGGLVCSLFCWMESL
jgi:RHS repeat-associated protein